MCQANRDNLQIELRLIRRKIEALRSQSPTSNLQRITVLQELNNLLIQQNEMILIRQQLITERLNGIGQKVNSRKERMLTHSISR